MSESGGRSEPGAPAEAGRRATQRTGPAGRRRRRVRRLGGGCARPRYRGAAGVGWARSIATSRRAPTSSSPSTATRSTPAPRPDRPCWRAARRRTARWRSGSDLFVDFLTTKHGLAAALQSDRAASTRCTPISSTGSCPCAPSCSMPRSPPGRSARCGRLRAAARDRQPLRRGRRDSRYDARGMVGLLVAGLRNTHPTSPDPLQLTLGRRGQPVSRSGSTIHGSRGRTAGSKRGEQLRRGDPFARRRQPHRGRQQ